VKKPIAVAEVKEGDFVRLGNDDPESHGGYVTATGTDGPYDTLTIDDGDRVSTARFEPGSTVWLVTL
jgi:hypothetical protein